MARSPSAVHLPFYPHLIFVAQSVEGFFAKLSKRRLKRGVFRSVRELKAAINASSTKPTMIPSPSPGPQTQTKSSQPSNEGTNC